jgi:putative flippase GtrA
MPMRDPRIGRQFVRFCLVGTLNTGLALLVYTAGVSAGVWYLAASVAGFAAGTVNGYLLNRVWTFHAGPATIGGLARYGFVQTGALGLNLATLFLLVDGAGVERIAAQALTLPLVSLVAFAGNRRWTFRTRRPEVA